MAPQQSILGQEDELDALLDEELDALLDAEISALTGGPQPIEKPSPLSFLSRVGSFFGDAADTVGDFAGSQINALSDLSIIANPRIDDPAKKMAAVDRLIGRSAPGAIPGVSMVEADESQPQKSPLESFATDPLGTLGAGVAQQARELVAMFESTADGDGDQGSMLSRLSDFGQVVMTELIRRTVPEGMPVGGGIEGAPLDPGSEISTMMARGAAELTGIPALARRVADPVGTAESLITRPLTEPAFLALEVTMARATGQLMSQASRMDRLTGIVDRVRAAEGLTVDPRLAAGRARPSPARQQPALPAATDTSRSLGPRSRVTVGKADPDDAKRLEGLERIKAELERPGAGAARADLDPARTRGELGGVRRNLAPDPPRSRSDLVQSRTLVGEKISALDDIERELAEVRFSVETATTRTAPAFKIRTSGDEAQLARMQARVREKAAVSRAQDRMSKIAESLSIDREAMFRFRMKALGRTTDVESVGEARAVIHEIRKAVAGGSPLQPPSPAEIRTAIRGMRQPSVSRGAAALGGTADDVTGTVAEARGALVRPDRASAGAILAEDVLALEIADAGKRTQEFVRDFTGLGLAWPDFTFSNPRAGESLRRGIRRFDNAFGDTWNRRLGPARKFARSRDNERTLVKALLDGRPPTDPTARGHYETIRKVLDETLMREARSSAESTLRGAGFLAPDEARAALQRGAANQEVQAAVQTLDEIAAGTRESVPFAEGYVPIINRLRGFEEYQQIPSDMRRFLPARFFNPHRLRGPENRAQIINEMIDEGARLEDMLRARLYVGLREATLNPTIQKLEMQLGASQALTSRKIFTVADAEAAGLVDEARILRHFGRDRPMTIGQQNAASLFLPKYTGGVGIDMQARVRSTAASLGLRRVAPGVDLGSVIARNTLTALIGFNPKTALKQLFQLQMVVANRGIIPTAVGAIVTTPKTFASVASRGVSRMVKIGTLGKVELPRYIPSFVKPGLLSNPSDALLTPGSSQLIRQAQSLYQKGAFFGLNEMENFVRGVAINATVFDEGLRQMAGTTGSVGKVGRIRAGIQGVWDTQFLYGPASNSPALMAMGSVGRAMNVLTTFTRKFVQFDVQQFVERPAAQIARARAAGKLAKESEAARKLFVKEVKRLPQEFAPLVRYYIMTGATLELGERVGINFEDVTGLGPLVSVLKFGSPFPAIDPVISFGAYIAAEMDEGARLEDRLRLKVKWMEDSVRYTGIPQAALETFFKWWTSQVHGVRTSPPAPDPEGFAGPFGLIPTSPENVPILRRAPIGRAGKVLEDVSENDLMDAIRAIIGEPLSAKEARAKRNELAGLASEVRVERVRNEERARSLVLQGVQSEDEDMVVQGLMILDSLGRPLDEVLAPPLLRQIRGMSNAEKIHAILNAGGVE